MPSSTPGWDIHRQGLFLAQPAAAAATLAGLLDHPAAAAAGLAGALDGEEALAGAHAPGAAAGLAVDGLRALLAAAAMAGLAGRGAGNAHVRLLAAEGVLQADGQVVAQIGAAGAALLSAAAAPAADEFAEHLVEDVGKVGGRETEAASLPGTTAGHALLEGGMAEAVIGRALLFVLQDVVGFVQFLEFLLGGLVARILVRVILHRRLAECLLDGIAVGVTGYAQQFIIVLLRHGCGADPNLCAVSQLH